MNKRCNQNQSTLFGVIVLKTWNILSLGSYIFKEDKGYILFSLIARKDNGYLEDDNFFKKT